MSEKDKQEVLAQIGGRQFNAVVLENLTEQDLDETRPSQWPSVDRSCILKITKAPLAETEDCIGKICGKWSDDRVVKKGRGLASWCVDSASL